MLNKLKPYRVWSREALFLVVMFLERNDLPGAWRVRKIFENIKFSLSQQKLVLCTTEHGFKMILDPFEDNGVELSIFQTGTYERGTLSVIYSVLKPGDFFVDVGANVGLMTLLAAHKVGPQGKVVAFEPLPEIRELLSASLKINSLQNTYIHSCALGSESSVNTIYRHPEVNRGSASIAWEGSSNQMVKIDIEPLDEILGKYTQSPTMIKIDVEGWELEVLKGGLNTLKTQPQPVVCVEFSRTHPLHGGTHEDMYQLMDSLGYSGYCLARSKAEKAGLKLVDIRSLPDHDNIFFFPSLRIGEYDPNLFMTGNSPRSLNQL